MIQIIKTAALLAVVVAVLGAFTVYGRGRSIDLAFAHGHDGGGEPPPDEGPHPEPEYSEPPPEEHYEEPPPKGDYFEPPPEGDFSEPPPDSEFGEPPPEGEFVMSRAARRCTTAAEESCTTGTMRKD